MDKHRQAWAGFLVVLLVVAGTLVAMRSLGVFDLLGGPGSALVIGVNLVVVGVVGILAFRRGRGARS